VIFAPAGVGRKANGSGNVEALEVQQLGEWG